MLDVQTVGLAPQLVPYLQGWALQREVHDTFIALVKSRRPALADNPDLFTGAFWSGERGLALGLVDRLGDLHTVLREKYGDDVRLQVMSAEKGLLRRRLGLAAPAASDIAEAAVGTIEERLLWNRYGL